MNSLWNRKEVTFVEKDPEEALFRILREVVASRPKLKKLGEYGEMYRAVAPTVWKAVDSNIKLLKVSKKTAQNAIVDLASRLIYWLIATDQLIRRDYFEALTALTYSDRSHGAFRALLRIEGDARSLASEAASHAALAGVKKRKVGVDARHAEWVAAAKKLLTSGTKKHNVVSIVARQFPGVTDRTIRTVLRNANVIERKK